MPTSAARVVPRSERVHGVRGGMGDELVPLVDALSLCDG